MPKGIRSLRGYVQRIEKLQRESTGDLFYRGHTRSTFVPLPSVFRNKGHQFNERNMIYDLIAESPGEFDSDGYTFDKLVRAQNYGVKTRLLDLTTNPLMGLYFACETDFSSRGQILVFETETNSIKYFLSDAVSCKANLSHLREEEREGLVSDVLSCWNSAKKRTGTKTGIMGMREEQPDAYAGLLEEFNNLTGPKRLVRFIREEKPYFQNSIDPIDLFQIDAVYPKKATREYWPNLERSCCLA